MIGIIRLLHHTSMPPKLPYQSSAKYPSALYFSALNFRFPAKSPEMQFSSHGASNDVYLHRKALYL